MPRRWPDARFRPPPDHSWARLEPGGEFVSRTLGNEQAGAVYQAGSIAEYACTMLALRMADEVHLAIEDPFAAMTAQDDWRTIEAAREELIDALNGAD
ncbi:MAG: hypothetical protein WA936_07380 [Erythrobacter sp.]|uniref:hypothetical protein n=1 Tax=Erythrobacter sp. TaxID=1042 RepID=UPI003C75B54B